MGLQRVGHDWATELNWMYKFGGGLLFISYWKYMTEQLNWTECINMVVVYYLLFISYWKNPKRTTKGNG